MDNLKEEQLIIRTVARVFSVRDIHVTPALNYWVYLGRGSITRYELDKLQDLLKADKLRYYCIFINRGNLVLGIQRYD